MNDEAGSPPHLVWAKGGSASFVAASDDLVTLHSSHPAPPGSRLEGHLVDASGTVLVLTSTQGPSPVRVKVKIHGSKREPNGSFVLRGKLLEASRELRTQIAMLVATPSDTR